MSTLRDILTSLVSATSNLAPRERALGVVLLSVASVSVAVAAADWADAAENRAIAAAEAAADIERVARLSTEDFSRTTLEKVAGQVKEMSFSGPTIAIARAEAQDVLRAATSAATIQEALVTLDPATASADNMAIQRLTIEGRFDWPSFLRLIDEVANLKQMVLARDLSVSLGRRPTFRLVLLVSLAGATT